MQEKYRITAGQIQLSYFTYEKVIDFYEWLKNKLGNSASTRNQRQAAINSFVRFLMYEYPDYLNEYQRILAIPLQKAEQKEISYAKTDEMKLFMEQIKPDTPAGLRDYIIFSVLYTTGIRVSELINIRVKDVLLQEPATIMVHGKGNKGRYVPLVKHMIPYLQKYMSVNHYDRPEKLNEWLFKNHMKHRFTRQGINYLVSKYRNTTNLVVPGTIPNDFSPHKIRHSTAMGLLESEVDLIYIRDLLGHSSIKTTEVYAKADSKSRRAAIEAASKEIVPKEEAVWETDSDLKEWLKNFNRR